MADALLKLPDDSGNTGKQLDALSLTVNAQLVHRERMNVTGTTATAVADVISSAPAGGDFGLVVRPIMPTVVVTMADGASVALGAVADAAVTGDNTGTVSAKLRGINKILADVWDSVNHRFSVNVANTTIAVTQSGTWNIGTLTSITNAVSVTNAGTFVVQENGSALTALQLIDDVIYTDDTSTHATGTSKVSGIGAVAAPTDTTLNANDIGMPGMSVGREMWSVIRDAAGNLRGANVDATNRLSVSVDNTVTVGSHAVTNAGTFSVQESTTCTTFHLASAGSTNATNVKASAGTLYGWYIYNSNAAARKVAFHNTSGTPTAGSAVAFSLVIPASSAANVHFNKGISFATGIGITTVTGLADSDATAVAANDLIINLWYA